MGKKKRELERERDKGLKIGFQAPFIGSNFKLCFHFILSMCRASIFKGESKPTLEGEY